MLSNQTERYFQDIDRISEWLYEQSGIYLTKIVIDGTGSYLDPQQKKSYIVYDHGDFVVVNYFDHKTQESISRRFNKNGTNTGIKIKRQPSRPHKPSASSKHCSRKRKQSYYDIRQFHHWLTLPNRAWHYLQRKRLESEGRQLIASNQLRFGNWKGGKHPGDWLAFPAESAIDGEPLGVQRIFEDGTKKDSKGFDKSTKLPCIWLGHNPDAEPVELNISEGIATAMSVMAARGTAISAIDAGTLPKVVKQLRQRYPNVPIYVYADNDNAGRKAVEKCKSLIQAAFFPAQEGQDWNDVLIEGGPEAINRQIPILPKPIKFYSPAAAQALLSQHINEFFQADKSKAASFTAGGGKTQITIDCLLPGTEIYEPNHAKCEELKADIEAKHSNLRVHIPKGRSAKFNATQRMCQKHEAADQLAQLGYQVYHCLCHNGKESCEFLGKKAFNDQGKLSNPTCPWVRQWLEPVEVRILPHAYLELERSNLETLSFTPRRVVIDERFYPIFLKTYHLPLLDFKDSDIDETIKKPLIQALREGLPLLKTLREAGITSAQLQAAVDTASSPSEPKLTITPGMSLPEQLTRLEGLKRPSNIKKILQAILEEWEQPRDECMGINYYVDNHKVEQISVHYKKPITRLRNERHKMLRVIDRLESATEEGLTTATLLKELRTTPEWLASCRLTLEQVGILRHTFNSNQPLKLAINYQTALANFRETTFYPLLIIDADADKRLLDPLLEQKEIEYIDIHCQDNLQVTQLSSASVSATSLQKSPDTYLNVAVKWAQERINEGKTVKIGGAQAFTGNPNQDLQPHPKLAALGDPVQFSHFGGLRGLNHFKDLDAGITIGRNQPPVYVIENEARALFAHDPKPLQLLGSQPLPKVPVAYRMRDSSLKWSNVERHPDERIQAILEQYREREIEQDIRRLRTVHHQGQPKDYLILANLPLPTIVVDELISTREFNSHTGSHAKAKTLIDHFFKGNAAPLVMPLTDPALLRHECPQVTFNTDDAARKFCQRMINENWKEKYSLDKTYIGTLLSDVQFKYPVKIISYRLKGQKGGRPSKALIACSYRQAQTQLELWLRQAVLLEGIPTSPERHQEYPPYFESEMDPSVIESFKTTGEIVNYLSGYHEESLLECIGDLLTEKEFIIWYHQNRLEKRSGGRRARRYGGGEEDGAEHLLK